MRLVSTLWAPGDPSWADVEVIDPRERGWWAQVMAVLRAARTADVVVLNGTSRFHARYRDFVIAAVLARWRRPPAVVFAETAWDLGSTALVQRMGILGSRLASVIRATVRALDGPHVTYCVLSEDERRELATAFSIPARRVAVTYFGHQLWSKADARTRHGDYVLAAGDSLRDYPTLVEAVSSLEARVRVVTHHDLRPVPDHVEVGPLPREEYFELLTGAGPVVVPLCPARWAAGLITFLDAMALGKLVIVSDTTGIREYVSHQRTGLLVAPRDPSALREALQWALDPVNREEVLAIGARAREDVLANRQPTAYWRAVRHVAERSAAQAVAGERRR